MVAKTKKDKKQHPHKHGAYITQGKTPLHFDPRPDKIKNLRKP